MLGPDLLARHLSEPGPPDRHGNRWQYHSRSDRHSKVASWGVALDLLSSSSLLRRHVQDGKVVLGVNHTMTDFATGRRKDLDLVIARPASGACSSSSRSFAGLADEYGLVVGDLGQGVLEALPNLPVAAVGAVLVAMEAKACMTAHVKSLPRLYDELNSSHLCVHGASRRALAIGYVQVNAADEFVSPVINNHLLGDGETVTTRHRQPRDSERVLAKVDEVPRRSTASDAGYDGLAVTVLRLRNDGSPVRLVHERPAPQPGESFHYASMVVRLANEYDTTFGSI